MFSIKRIVLTNVLLGVGLALSVIPLEAKAQAQSPVFRSDRQAGAKSARESFQQGDITSAIRQWSKEIRAEKDVETALFHRAQAYVVLSQYDFALADANRLISLQKKKPVAESFVVRGVVLTALNRLDEAIADFNQSEALRPSALVYSNRALAYQRSGQFDKAILDFQQAIQLEPTLLNQINLSNARIQNGDAENAVQEMSDVIEQNSKFYPAYLSRGIAYHQLGQHEPAIRDFVFSLNLSPTQAQAYYYAGLSLAALGHNQEAMDNLERAADLYLQQGQSHLYHAILEKMDASTSEDI